MWVLVLIVPMLIVIVTTYFSSMILSTILFVLIGIVGFIILLGSSYLLGLFHVFTTAVWVLTFSVLASKNNPEITDVDLGNDTFKAPVKSDQPAPVPENIASESN